VPRAGKMKECSRRPRETDHVSTTCGEAHELFELAEAGTANTSAMSSIRMIIEVR
jgi:hypothetical protein